ncbi:MAG: helix-turn-helix transcriptional regulator [candidate division WOR-3 bacterium]|nr:helix-turn-helix transcriptional regulator [candidate division WOR-3 bacterium]
MIEKAEWYERLTKDFDKDPEYWVEEMRFAFSDEVGRIMDERGVSRAELARRLNSSPAYVTRLFRAMFNPTLLTLAKVAVALDAKVALHLSPNEAERTQWFDFIPAERPASAKVESCWPSACGEPLEPTVSAGGRDERTKAPIAA